MVCSQCHLLFVWNDALRSIGQANLALLKRVNLNPRYMKEHTAVAMALCALAVVGIVALTKSLAQSEMRGNVRKPSVTD